MITLTCFRSHVVHGFSVLTLGSLLLTKYKTSLGSLWNDCFPGVTFLAKVKFFIISPLNISTCSFLPCWLSLSRLIRWHALPKCRRSGLIRLAALLVYRSYRSGLYLKQMCNFSWDFYWNEYAHLHTAFKFWFWEVLAFVKLSLFSFLTRLWFSLYVCNVPLSVLWPLCGLSFVKLTLWRRNFLLNFTTPCI
jgi:hypothetical protein